MLEQQPFARLYRDVTPDDDVLIRVIQKGALSQYLYDSEKKRIYRNLTQDEYIEQLNDPDNPWMMKEIGLRAAFDDDHFEETHV